jgi:hypothetical protein
VDNRPEEFRTVDEVAMYNNFRENPSEVNSIPKLDHRKKGAKEAYNAEQSELQRQKDEWNQNNDPS